MTNEEIIELFKNNTDIEVDRSGLNETTDEVEIHTAFKKESAEGYYVIIYKDKKRREKENKYYNYLYNNGINTFYTIFSGKYYDKEINIFDNYFECVAYNNNLVNREYDIGKTIATIHNLKPLDEELSWTDFLLEKIEKAHKGLKEILDNDLNDFIYNYLKKYINEELKNNYKNTLIHCNLSKNCVIGKEGYIAIIDLENVRNGDYIYDLRKINEFISINIFTNENNFNKVLDGYKSIRNIDDNISERIDFYGIYDRYVFIYESNISKYYSDVQLNFIVRYLERKIIEIKNRQEMQDK